MPSRRRTPSATTTGTATSSSLSPEERMTEALAADPSYQPPSSGARGWEIKDGKVVRKGSNWIDKIGPYLPLIGAGAGVGLGAAFPAGGAAAAAGGAAATVPSIPNVTTGLGAGASTMAAGSSSMGIMDILKLLGLQTGSGILGGLIGGSDPAQRRPLNPNAEQSKLISPENSLYTYAQALMRFGQSLQDKSNRGVQLRTTATAPKGFTADPAIADPSMLRKEWGGEMWDPFQSFAPQQEAAAAAKRRNPGG